MGEIMRKKFLKADSIDDHSQTHDEGRLQNGKSK